MLTPFTRGGRQVDFDKAAALASRLAGKGVSGLFVAGTTGEGMLMDLAERKRLIEVVIEAVGKRLAVIPHAGCLSTRDTIDLVEHGASVGARAAGMPCVILGPASEGCVPGFPRLAELLGL